MPTATPTPVPWATLTPYPTSQATAFVSVDIDSYMVDIAEKAVQSYDMLESSPIFDIVFFALIFLIVLFGLYRIVHRLQDM